MSSPAPAADAHALPPEVSPWAVRVVDDDPGVLAISRLALRSVRVADRDLALVMARSAAEALHWLEHNAEPDLLLLDLQLETADSGAALLRDMRERLGFRAARVLVRSGGEVSAATDLSDLDVARVIGKAEVGLAELRTIVAAALTERADRYA